MKMILDDRIELSMNATLKIPADHWSPSNRSAEIKNLADALAHLGEIGWLRVEPLHPAGAGIPQSHCPVCGWIHDPGFTQIDTGQLRNIVLNGRLPQIVALVHRAHEQGRGGLGIKDDELQKTCGGYRHPCKAFDDLKHRHHYKILFDTRQRGLLSLRRNQ
jgi:hypothetical protein